MASRYVCPNCGSGKLAPERPRRDDVRVYCLACSEKTGRLVKRVSPALERKREAGRARSVAKAQTKRERERAKWIVKLKDANGVLRSLDVRAELARALRDMGYRRTVDDVDITIRRGKKPHHSGHAWGVLRVAFTFGRGSYEEALTLIYHEAAHLADSCHNGHGVKFHRTLADGLQKRWPWIVYGSLKPNQRGGSWEMHQRPIRQMRDHVRSGGTL